MNLDTEWEDEDIPQIKVQTIRNMALEGAVALLIMNMIIHGMELEGEAVPQIMFLKIYSVSAAEAIIG